MKQLVLAGTALSIAAFAPVGSNPCREVREQVMQPMHDVAEYLRTNRSVETLSSTGCLYILSNLERLPFGAQLIRDLGARGLENTQNRCTTTVNSIRYPCSEPSMGQPRCLPEAYSYCGQWEYSMTAQPKYELAMELSTQVELAYDKAQQLCGAAMSWDEAGTAIAVQDLLSYLDSSIGPKSEKLYELSCGE